MSNPLNFGSDFGEVDGLSCFDQVVEVGGDKLRPGMVLVDDLGCAVFGLDVKDRAVPGSGQVQFLVHDFENGGVRSVGFLRNGSFPVAAR